MLSAVKVSRNMSPLFDVRKKPLKFGPPDS